MTGAEARVATESSSFYILIGVFCSLKIVWLVLDEPKYLEAVDCADRFPRRRGEPEDLAKSSTRSFASYSVTFPVRSLNV